MKIDQELEKALNDLIEMYKDKIDKAYTYKIIVKDFDKETKLIALNCWKHELGEGISG